MFPLKKILLSLGLSLLPIMGIAQSISGDDFDIDASTPGRRLLSPVNNGKMIAYLPGWATPPAPQDLATAGYTHVIVAYAVLSTITPGQIISNFNGISSAYIKTLQNNGIKVLLSLGGPSTDTVNATVDFHSVLSKVSDPNCFVEEFVSSVEDALTQYGFDGLDIHIEQGLLASGSISHATGDIPVLSQILHTLRRKHPGLLLSLTPQMNNISPTSKLDNQKGNYAALIMQTAPILSWVGIQLYNSACSFGINQICYGFDPSHPEKYEDTYVAMATNLLEDWPAKNQDGQRTGFQPYISYLKPSQIVLGFPVVDKNGTTDNAVPAPSNTAIKHSLSCLRTGRYCNQYKPPSTYPELGGVFAWQVSYDQNNHYNFAESLRKCVLLWRCE